MSTHPSVHCRSARNSKSSRNNKQPQCTSIGEWIKKMYIYIFNTLLCRICYNDILYIRVLYINNNTHEYYSNMRRRTFYNLQLYGWTLKADKDNHLYLKSKKLTHRNRKYSFKNRGWRLREMGRCWSKGTNFTVLSKFLVSL